MYLFQKIEELMMEYNDARRDIGKFILNEKGNILNYSMKEVAELTYTSKPTLVRFAKALGYNGWKEFIKAFTEETFYQQTSGIYTDPNFPFSEGDTVKDIILSLKNLQIESIMDTVDLLDPKMVDKATDILYNANNIVIYGVSPNTFNAHIFRRKMLSIGKNVVVASSNEAGLLSSTLTKNDCAIVISYSGNNKTKEPLCYIKSLQDKEIPLIAITSGGNNYLRENIECVFTISSRERLYSKISNFSTDQSISFILNTLYSSYFAKDYRNNLQYKIRNAEILEEPRMTTLSNVMEKRY